MKKLITVILMGSMCLHLDNLAQTRASAQEFSRPVLKIARAASWLTPIEIAVLRRNGFAVHGDYTPEDNHPSLIRTWYDIFLPGWEFCDCGIRSNDKTLCQVNNPQGEPATREEVREFLNR